MTRIAAGFLRFWWDFVVGDDWKIAAAVALVLGVAAVGVAETSGGGSWLAPLVGAALVLAFLVSLAVDVRG